MITANISNSYADFRLDELFFEMRMKRLKSGFPNRDQALWKV
jgi:hypothetical protein